MWAICFRYGNTIYVNVCNAVVGVEGDVEAREAILSRCLVLISTTMILVYEALSNIISLVSSSIIIDLVLIVIVI